MIHARSESAQLQVFISPDSWMSQNDQNDVAVGAWLQGLHATMVAGSAPNDSMQRWWQGVHPQQLHATMVAGSAPTTIACNDGSRECNQSAAGTKQGSASNA